MARLRLLLASLGAALLLPACAEEPPPAPPIVRPVKMLTLGATAGSGMREYTGQVSAAQNSEMAFEVDGKIVEFPLKEGQIVDEGTLLARLDPRDYETKLAIARAELERSKAFRDRVRSASSSGAVSEQDVTDADARYDQSISVVEEREKALDDTFLRAPLFRTA